MNKKLVARELLRVAKLLLAVKAVKADRLETFFEGDNIRVFKSDHGCEVRVQELPAKGKKRLRNFSFSANWQDVSYDNMLLNENILDFVKPNKGMTIEQFQGKMDEYLKQDSKSRPGKTLRDVGYYNTGDVSFLEVQPPNTKPISVKGKDFAFDVSWTDFKVYSPQSDFQQSDPHYSGMEASAPGMARKLYKMLIVKPDLLKSMSYNDLGDFLRANKINYKSFHSVWH